MIRLPRARRCDNPTIQPVSGYAASGERAARDADIR